MVVDIDISAMEQGAASSSPDLKKTKRIGVLHEKKQLKWIERWFFFFVRVTRLFRERFISVDLTNEWRRHLVWSKKNGNNLKDIVLARYANTTVFLSLLFGTEMSVIYSPSQPADVIREALRTRDFYKVEYYTGFVLCIAILFSVTALVANFTAWSIFNGLSKENAPIVLRSSLGIYCAQLPARLVVAALYLFLLFIILTWWVLMASETALAFSILALLLLNHVMNSFSAIGRIMMMTGAMSDIPLFDEETEEKMNPEQLSDALIYKYKLAKKAHVDVMKQYRIDFQQLLQDVEDGGVIFPIAESDYERRETIMLVRRFDSKVRHSNMESPRMRNAAKKKLSAALANSESELSELSNYNKKLNGASE